MYSWKAREPSPDWLAAALRTTAGDSVSDVELDQDHNVFYAGQHLRNLVERDLVGVEKEGGDGWTFQTACVTRGYGLTEETTLALMSEYFDPACRPPWGDEMAVKVHNAFEYCKDKGYPDYTDPAETEFAHYVAQYRAETAPMDGIDFDDLIAMKIDPPAMLIPDYIQKGIPNFIVGHGGAQKSRLVLHMAATIRGGGKFLDRQCVKTPVIFFSAEDNAKEVGLRLQSIARRLELGPAPGSRVIDRQGQRSALVSMREGGDYSTTPFYQSFVATLAQTPGHKLVVLDSCVDFVHFVRQAKIDETAVNEFIKGFLQRICDECDCTLLIIWHTSASGKDDGSGWSVGWHNAPRNKLGVKKISKGVIEFSQLKRSHGAEADTITLYYDNGALLPRSEAETTKIKTEFLETCVEVAVRAAQTGQHLSRRNVVAEWAVDCIHHKLGQRPSNRDVKEALEKALSLKLLRYMPSGRGQSAGYYPWDMQRLTEDVLD